MKKTLINDSANKAFVEIGVNLRDEATSADELYITGNIPELGGWDVSKAVKLRRKGGRYLTSVEYGSDMILEFKILNKKDWNGVEKGTWGEEIANHQVNPSETRNLDIDIHKWNC